MQYPYKSSSESYVPDEVLGEVMIYPNPAMDQFNVLITGENDETVVLEIINMNGVALYREDHFKKNVIQYIGEGLESGVYIMLLQTMEKFLITN